MAKNPSLEGLSLNGVLSKVLPDRHSLKDLGWAAAGGSAGGVAMGFIMPQVDKLPLLGTAPPILKRGLIGVLVANLAYNWNKSFGLGLAGNVLGNALTEQLKALGLPLGDYSLGFTTVPGTPGAEELRDAGMGDAMVDPEQLAEVEPSQEFDGLDARVENVPPLGAFLGG